MPNVIVELTNEILRVRSLFPFYDAAKRSEAEAVIGFARQNLALNSLEGMKESIDDLRSFVKPRSLALDATTDAAKKASQ